MFDVFVKLLKSSFEKSKAVNPQIDNYLAQGCGRCPLGGTPQCKVHNWPEELKLLRRLAVECGLIEELKWGVPCYTYRGKNILTVSALKDFTAIGFFKGSLLSDPEKLLSKPGEHSQAARYIKVTDSKRAIENEDVIKAYIFEAIEVERAGLKVEFEKSPEPIPEELQSRLDEDPVLKAAFEALTPGRQRVAIFFIFHSPSNQKLDTLVSRGGHLRFSMERVCTTSIGRGEESKKSQPDFQVGSRFRVLFSRYRSIPNASIGRFFDVLAEISGFSTQHFFYVIRHILIFRIA